MPLSNQVYLGAHAPDNTAAAISVVKTKPDPYKSFMQGYDDQQKRNLALQEYRQAVVKADMANALYPYLKDSQIAQLQARINGFNNPQNPYAPTGSGVGPINSVPGGGAPGGSTPASAPAGTPVAPAATPPTYDNPFSGPAQPLFQQGTPGPAVATPMIPGLADASPYSSGDFSGAGDLGGLSGLFG